MSMGKTLPDRLPGRKDRDVDLGDLRADLARARVTRAEVAGEMDRSVQYISQLLTGTQSASPGQLQRLARACAEAIRTHGRTRS